MDRDTRKLLARIKAYRLEGLSFRQIGQKVGRSTDSVSNLLRRDREKQERRARGTPERVVKYEAVGVYTTYQVPAYRPNDCHKHLSLIAEAHGTGFPVLNLPPAYRVAA